MLFPPTAIAGAGIFMAVLGVTIAKKIYQTRTVQGWMGKAKSFLGL